MSSKKKSTQTLNGSLTSNPPKNGSKFRRFLSRLFRFIRTMVIILSVGVFLLFIVPRLINELAQAPKIYDDLDEVPESRVAIVFGAGLKSDGTVTRILRDRVNAAIQLYEAGKVDKILLSGDNRFVEYNEPGAMYEHAIAEGVPDDVLVMDYAGRRTYDTCYRAKEIFQVDEAILVTQKFHLARALFLCNSLGVDSVGYTADLSYYLKRSRMIWNIRETPATSAALYDIWFRKPIPVLGEPLPIFPYD